MLHELLDLDKLIELLELELLDELLLELELLDDELLLLELLELDLLDELDDELHITSANSILTTLNAILEVESVKLNSNISFEVASLRNIVCTICLELYGCSGTIS